MGGLLVISILGGLRSRSSLAGRCGLAERAHGLPEQAVERVGDEFVELFHAAGLADGIDDYERGALDPRPVRELKQRRVPELHVAGGHLRAVGVCCGGERLVAELFDLVALVRATLQGGGTLGEEEDRGERREEEGSRQQYHPTKSLFTIQLAAPSVLIPVDNPPPFTFSGCIYRRLFFFFLLLFPPSAGRYCQLLLKPTQQCPAFSVSSILFQWSKGVHSSDNSGCLP
ncbi:hypothetical protein GUJ93_ZPchr0005g14468 [Zizania palustris]|uniref:Uncharacterized protein n=1 Tax=Zizania palustris TaxID=103762 RepID=A0A8J5SUA0_ZIZPA|nr:hypothetical protein GUJ93_ZPchr0005g14468 [Zizania palustris]